MGKRGGCYIEIRLNSCESWDRTCDQVTKGARLLRLGRDGQGLLGVTVLTVCILTFNGGHVFG